MLQKSPTKHYWSTGFPIYEGIVAVKCRGCGAVIGTTEVEPTDEEILHQKLPLDCDEAIPVVIHEEYVQTDPEDLWEEDDQHREHVWPSKNISEDPLQSVEAVETKSGTVKA